MKLHILNIFIYFSMFFDVSDGFRMVLDVPGCSGGWGGMGRGGGRWGWIGLGGGS